MGNTFLSRISLSNAGLDNGDRLLRCRLLSLQHFSVYGKALMGVEYVALPKFSWLKYTFHALYLSLVSLGSTYPQHTLT